jgi:hypothetical protein
MCSDPFPQQRQHGGLLGRQTGIGLLFGFVPDASVSTSPPSR